MQKCSRTVSLRCILQNKLSNVNCIVDFVNVWRNKKFIPVNLRRDPIGRSPPSATLTQKCGAANKSSARSNFPRCIRSSISDMFSMNINRFKAITFLKVYGSVLKTLYVFLLVCIDRPPVQMVCMVVWAAQKWQLHLCRLLLTDLHR
jgi:hypothetical protein